MQPAWPDWTGRTACVIAAGASARATVARLQGRPPAIAINRSYELATWADVLYAADGAFWAAYPAALLFAGTRATASDELCRKVPGLAHVRIAELDATGPLRGPVGTVGHGGHSGYQAINLAAQFRPRRIVLIGFDLAGPHWHPDHSDPRLRNANENTMAVWANRLADAAPTYRDWGIEILNASPASALTCFPRCRVEDVFTLAEI